MKNNGVSTPGRQMPGRNAACRRRADKLWISQDFLGGTAFQHARSPPVAVRDELTGLVRRRRPSHRLDQTRRCRSRRRIRRRPIGPRLPGLRALTSAPVSRPKESIKNGARRQAGPATAAIQQLIGAAVTGRQRAPRRRRARATHRCRQQLARWRQRLQERLEPIVTSRRRLPWIARTGLRPDVADVDRLVGFAAHDDPVQVVAAAGVVQHERSALRPGQPALAHAAIVASIG